LYVSVYPTVTIIENKGNYGFTGGYNRVLSQVNADYYILLNSDVEVDARMDRAGNSSNGK
jgi:GT2 family glycosyltransferase